MAGSEKGAPAKPSETPGHSPDRGQFGRAASGYLAVAIVAAAIFWPTLNHGFVYDDAVYVVNNPQIRSLNRFFEAFATTFPKHLPEYSTYRPLMHMTLSVDYALADKIDDPDPMRAGKIPDPWPFHLENILWHAASAAALLWLLRLLLAGDKRWRWAPEVATLAFALHPVHVEVVANVTGRTEAMAGFFYLLALGCFLKLLDAAGRPSRPAWLAATLATLFLSLSAKETAITFPLAAAFIVWMRRGPSAFSVAPLREELASDKGKNPSIWTKRFSGQGSLGETVWLLLPLGALAFFYLIVRVWAIGVLSAHESLDYYVKIPGLSRSASSAFIFFYYLKMLLVPDFYYPDYGYPFHFLGFTVGRIESWAHPWAWVGAASIALVLGLFARLAWKRSAWAWPLGLYLIPLGVYMQLIPFGDIAGDRFLYTPSAGFCLLLGMAFARFYSKKAGPGLLVAALVLAGLGWKTLEQSKYWENSVTFHELMIQWDDNEEAQYSHGFLLRQKGIYLGQEYFAKKNAGRLKPGEGQRIVSEMMGYYEQALKRMERTLELNPNFDKARLAIAQIHAHSLPPRYDLSRENVFRLLDERFPYVAHQAPRLYRLIASTYGEEKNWPEALSAARKAWRHDQNDQKSIRLLAEFSYQRALQAFEQERDPDLALKLLRDAKRLDPSRRDAREVLAQMLERLKRWPEALEEWKDLARDYPREAAYKRRAEAIAKALAQAAAMQAQAQTASASSPPETPAPAAGD